MHRAQIIIEEWQYEALKSLAERTGRSVSALVREILEERLGSPAERPATRLEAITGIGQDPEASGREHDAYLYNPER
jgi:plasmid stability protein